MESQFSPQAHREYLENRVFSAHPVERVQMLYDIAIDSVNVAIARFKDGDIFARGNAVTRAHEAVDELNLALDHSVGASFTRTLAELYAYVQRQLSKGHTQKSLLALEEALSVLSTLADAWKTVVERTLTSNPAPADCPAELPEIPHTQVRIAEPSTAYGGLSEASPTSRDWSC